MEAKGFLRLTAVALAIVLSLSGFAGAAGQLVATEDPQLAAALSNENLLAAAQRTSDGKTLLGLARYAGMAQPRTPVRQADGTSINRRVEGLKARAEILARVTQVAPAEAPAAAALACWDAHAGIDAVERFLKADATNGAPYYLKARLLLDEGKTAEGLAAFREGLAQKQFTVYDTSEYRRGIISALDLLGLSGEARLRALVRAVESRTNPRDDSIYMSFFLLSKGLLEAAEGMPAQEREALAEEMTRFSGKLIDENGLLDEGLHCAYGALGDASSVRAAAGDADTKRALAIGAGAIRSTWKYESAPRDFAWALSIACRPPLDRQYAGEYRGFTAEEKALADKALAPQEEASRRLLDLLSPKPDEIVGRAVVSDISTAFHALKDEQKEIADAAERVLSAKESTDWAMGDLCSAVRNKENLKRLGVSLIMFVIDNNDMLPPDLQTLKDKGYLESGAATCSIDTRTPYVYVAPGMSLKGRDSARTILVYDAVRDGAQAALFADGHVLTLPKATISRMLEEQQK